MDTKKLLELRANKKSTKPVFVRQNVGKIVEAGTKYRRPRGYHSKLRLCIKGKGILPSQGFGSPNEIKHANAEGFFEVMVNNIADLSKVKDKNQCAVISATVGMKKRIDILKKATELKIKVSNDRDAEKLAKSFEDAKKSRIDKKVSRAKAVEAKNKISKAKADKKAKKTKKEENTVADEKETADADKKKQEKILIDKNKAM